jgi:DNA ligase 1
MLVQRRMQARSKVRLVAPDVSLSELETTAYMTPTDGKKRSRPSNDVKNSSKVAVGKGKTSPEVDDAGEEPAPKKARKSRRIVDDDEDDDIMEEAPPVVKEEPKKPLKTSARSKPAQPVPTKKGTKLVATVKVEEDEEEQSTASSANEQDPEAEDEEDEEDEEKPEVIAKVRKTVQTTLTSKGKDPYPDWKPGEPVPYAALCTTFSLIELTTKRLVIMEHCSLFLRQVLRLTPGDLLPTVLLMINRLAPDYTGIELGIGESLIMKAIGETTGRSLAVIKQDQKEIGDLGLVAVKSRSTQPTMFKPKPLTVQGVWKGLMNIATVTGNGAQGRKVDGIKKLLAAADAHSTGKVDITKDKGGPSEAKYLVRFLEGKLRLGLAERTVLVSLAQAVICHEADQKGTVPSTADMENAEATLKTVYR